ncbi:hypothetical protein EKO27_g10108, partial [Xylaria grammica]
LLSLYGVDTATDGAVLAKLKRELAGEVHCVTFGAAVQRDVFEAALEKVIGFLPARVSADDERAGEEAEEEEEGTEMEIGQEGSTSVRTDVPPGVG